LESGFVTEEQLYGFMGEKIHIPYVNISKYTIGNRVLKHIKHTIFNFYGTFADFVTIGNMDKKRVLIVDDEQDIVESIKFNLELEGIECLEAYDGEQTLAKAKKRTPGSYSPGHHAF